MAFQTVEGVFREGKVELTETPTGAVNEARVLVTFLPSNGPEASAMEPLSSDERRAAMERVLKRFEEGMDFGGPPYPKREELYDRVLRYGDRNG